MTKPPLNHHHHHHRHPLVSTAILLLTSLLHPPHHPTNAQPPSPPPTPFPRRPPPNLLHDPIPITVHHTNTTTTQQQPVLSSSSARTYQRTPPSATPPTYQPLRFGFLSSPIDSLLAASSPSALPTVTAKRDAILNDVLPRVADDLSRALYLAVDSFAFDIPANMCYVQHPEVKGFDKDVAVLIDADDLYCDGGTLAYAQLCGIDSVTNRPILGLINFCLEKIDVDDEGRIPEEELESLRGTLVHEVVHVLGLVSNMFVNYWNREKEKPRTREGKSESWIPCVNGQPSQFRVKPNGNTVKYREEEVAVHGGGGVETRGYYEITLPTVKQIVQNQFGCKSLTGARLENQPTNPEDCFGSHLDERFFLTDLMSPIANRDGDVFSPLVLAVLEDSGWYVPDYNYARNSPFGIGAGCGFVEEDCVEGGKVGESGRGVFCVDERGGTRCGTAHGGKAVCDLGIQGGEKVSRKYFENSNLGSQFIWADHCPLPVLLSRDCSTTNGILQYSWESYGPNSKCLNILDPSSQSSPTNFDGANDDVTGASCVRVECNERDGTFDFWVGESVYSCDEDFAVVDVDVDGSGFVKFQCPRLAVMCPDIVCPAMCSGRGICNWNLPKPACECFDPDNTNRNCNPYFREIATTLTPTVGNVPSGPPSVRPSVIPSGRPSWVPSVDPSGVPSVDPSGAPSVGPSGRPSGRPTEGAVLFESLEVLREMVGLYCGDDDWLGLVEYETYGAIDEWDVSQINDMSSTFDGYTNCNPNIEEWDVSSVTSFFYMFRGAGEFNRDIGGWDVSNGTNFSGMFNGATSFDGDIGEWDLSSGTYLNFMFQEAGSFNHDIGGWNVVEGEYFESMFNGATSFNQNIGGWDVSNGNYFNDMFHDAISFQQDLTSWPNKAWSSDHFCTDSICTLSHAPSSAPTTSAPTTPSPTDSPTLTLSNSPTLSNAPSSTPSTSSLPTISLAPSESSTINRGLSLDSTFLAIGIVFISILFFYW